MIDEVKETETPFLKNNCAVKEIFDWLRASPCKVAVKTMYKSDELDDIPWDYFLKDWPENSPRLTKDEITMLYWLLDKAYKRKKKGEPDDDPVARFFLILIELLKLPPLFQLTVQVNLERGTFCITPGIVPEENPDGSINLDITSTSPALKQQLRAELAKIKETQKGNE